MAKFSQGTLTHPEDMQTYQEEIWQPYLELRTKWDIASVYIDDEDEIETIKNALETLNNANTWLKSMAMVIDEDFWREEPATDYRVDRDEYGKMRDSVTDVLKPKLDPPEAGP